MMTERIRSRVDFSFRIGGMSTKPLLLGLFILCVIAESEAVDFRFEKIADQSTPIPNGVGTFESFGVTNTAPVLHDGDVAFYASGISGQRAQHGVYTTIGGSLRVVVDRNTPYPGGGTFSPLMNTEPSIFGDQVSFSGGTTSGARGVFLEEIGTLNVVADTSTTIPGKSTTFTRFIRTSTSSDNVAFTGDDVPLATGGAVRGVYKKVGGSLTKVVEADELMPGAAPSFAGFSNISISSSDVVVRGFNSDFSHQGIYTDRGGIFRKVADTGTPIPNGGGSLFHMFFAPAIGNDGITFYGNSTGASHGIYIEKNGTLNPIVDNNSLLPGVEGSFSIGGPHAFDGQRVVFQAFKATSALGLFLADQGSIVKIIDSTDTLDGRSPNRFYINAEGFDDGQVAFKVEFSDGSLAIYKAVIIPEPSGSLMMLIAMALVGRKTGRS